MNATNPLPANIAAARAALTAGDTALAESFARARLAQSPEDDEALVLAGDIALDRHQPREAAELYARVLARDDENIDALCGRARAALSLRDPAAALTHARRAFDVAPRLHALYLSYGPAAISEQDNEGVDRCYSFLETIPPADSLALVEYWASCLTYLERHEKAAVVYSSIIDILPPDYERTTRYAEMLLRAFKPEEAKPFIDAAIVMAPNRAEAHAMRARWATQTGHIEVARTAARDAIGRDAHCESAYIQLARLDAKEIGEADCVHLTDMLDSHALPPQRRYIAGLALGMGLEAVRKYEAAFDAFSRANQIAHEAACASGRGYDPKATEALVAKTMTYFPVGAAPAAAGKDDGRDLIFITGMPRSGTTLLDQILASHSKVTSVGEHLVMPSLNALFLQAAENSSDGPGRILEANAEDWRSIYRGSIEPRRGRAAYFVDKNLMNFWAAGFVHYLFPAAKILFMKRDKMDVGLSIFRQNFLQFYNFTNNLEEIAHYYLCHDILTRHWREAAPNETTDVCYEAMLDDLSGSVRNILAFCGLPMEDACLNFKDNDRAVFTLSATQVRSGLFTTSRERWRRYEGQLAPLRAALGARPPQFAPYVTNK